MRRNHPFLLLVLIGIGLLCMGQSGFNPDKDSNPTALRDIHPPDVIQWQPVGGASRFQDGTIEVGLRMTTKQDFSLYTDKVKFKVPYILDKVVSPSATQQIDPISEKPVSVYTGGEFFLYFRPPTEVDLEKVTVGITYLGCTTKICLFPFTEEITIPVFTQDSTAAPRYVSTRDAPDTDEPTIAAGSGSGGDFEAELAARVKKGDLSFWMLVFIVLLGGVLTNLTPCVAPMIPITIRLLSNQNFPPLINSSLYAGGILVTYTLLGAVATFSGTAFGSFMSSPSLNIVFALVMALLALSMLGFGNLSSLQTIGSRIGAGKPSAFNTFLMGTGAGLVAAPCTGPILGALLAYTAARQEPVQGVALMGVYSLGFAVPYVFLGSAASRVTSMRVNPMLQVASKFLFSAVMFGLSFYYLRIPAYQVAKTLQPYWGQLAMVGLAVGLILTGIWLWHPKLSKDRYLMIIPCFILGAGIFSGSQWLTSSDQTQNTNLVWYKDKQTAFAKAKNTGRPILIDNWAEWCEACKKMDRTTFVDQNVQTELQNNWVVVKLDLTEGTEQDDLHMETYDIFGLPTLVLLKPDADAESSENITGYVTAPTLLRELQRFRQGR